ncbi:transposase [Microbacterium sp. SD291]|nr:transposase [Microbacterium sp. SD291]
MIERVDRAEISKRAAADELMVSSNRINVMLAHVRGEQIDPVIAREQMDDKLRHLLGRKLYAKRQHSIEPVFGNIKNNLGYRRFTRRGLDAVSSEWRLICTAHNLLKLRTSAA